MPLRLDWEPWYSTTEELHPGARVRVRLAGHEYVAVVSSTGGTPDIAPGKIQPISGIEERLEDISTEEIRFWRFIADYYLCTVGEVYKAVYPASRTAAEERKSRKSADGCYNGRRKPVTAEQKNALIQILDGFAEHRSVLLHGPGRENIYMELCRRCMDAGKDVLLLRAGAAKPGYVAQRELAKAVRSTQPTLVEGHRSNIFLPFSKLGLVIVDDEESPSYKQNSGAPRYQTRDAAIALAAMHGADVLLGSDAPSLESVHNAACGKYLSVSLPATDKCVIPEVIDTEAELRKNGMLGALSRKMLDAVTRAMNAKERVLVLSPWNNFTDTEYRFRQQIRDNRFDFNSLSKINSIRFGRYSVVVIMNAEAMLDNGDFRADEKAFRTFKSIAKACTGRLVIQCRNASHPVFAALSAGVADINAQLLAERISFGYPPQTRLVEIRINDKNEARLAKMSAELSRYLGGLQFFLPKDRQLAGSKREIARKVREFEESRRYRGHIIIDVDP